MHRLLSYIKFQITIAKLQIIFKLQIPINQTHLELGANPDIWYFGEYSITTSKLLKQLPVFY